MARRPVDDEVESEPGRDREGLRRVHRVQVLLTLARTGPTRNLDKFDPHLVEHLAGVRHHFATLKEYRNPFVVLNHERRQHGLKSVHLGVGHVRSAQLMRSIENFE